MSWGRTWILGAYCDLSITGPRDGSRAWPEPFVHVHRRSVQERLGRHEHGSLQLRRRQPVSWMPIHGCIAAEYAGLSIFASWTGFPMTQSVVVQCPGEYHTSGWSERAGPRQKTRSWSPSSTPATSTSPPSRSKRVSRSATTRSCPGSAVIIHECQQLLGPPLSIPMICWCPTMRARCGVVGETFDDPYSDFTRDGRYPNHNRRLQDYGERARLVRAERHARRSHFLDGAEHRHWTQTDSWPPSSSRATLISSAFPVWDTIYGLRAEVHVTGIDSLLDPIADTVQRVSGSAGTRLLQNDDYGGSGCQRSWLIGSTRASTILRCGRPIRTQGGDGLQL